MLEFLELEHAHRKTRNGDLFRKVAQKMEEADVVPM
jgi:hypothetical protein